MQDPLIGRIEALRRELLSNARDPAHPPRLLPVTKMQPIERILPLAAAGITEIGENRVQEIMEKYPELGAHFAFHVIGRLQTNKIKYIIGRVCMVQSLDRPALAQALDARAQSMGVRLPVLLEINQGEAQKGGIPPDEAEALLRYAARLPGLDVRGLMAVMPLASDPETLRPLFAGMRALQAQLRDLAVSGVSMDELSMGMSGDWHIAAQEGATIVRIGSAIFGHRTLGNSQGVGGTNGEFL
ncbi:MAG: YggS family pyridoxal phosphate-dependent enzyme [Oscillospiraceae bacterium]|jgi:pyridoxal phosphate enzyme (YggS family)|nr:YggS family pyridoxal phosphate-dependent enzyme [Oscillospiraceae bacterium]